jgi:hypothetical protein
VVGELELSWGPIVERAVGPLAVIYLTPAFESTPNIVECSEPGGIKALVSQPAVEALEMAVLHRTAGLDVDQSDFRSLAQASMRREVKSGPRPERTIPHQVPPPVPPHRQAFFDVQSIHSLHVYLMALTPSNACSRR